MPKEIVQFCGFFHEFDADRLKFMRGRHVRAVARKADAAMRLIAQVRRIGSVVFLDFHAIVPMTPRLGHENNAGNIIPRYEPGSHKYW